MGPAYTRGRAGRKRRPARGGAQLPPDGVDVAQHPQRDDALAVAMEERRARPFDDPAGGRHAEQGRPVPAPERHARGGATIRDHQVVDDARIVGQSLVNGAQVGEEAVDALPLGAERAAKTEVLGEDFPGDRLVGAVPDLVIEAFDEGSRADRHRRSLSSFGGGPCSRTGLNPQA